VPTWSTLWRHGGGTSGIVATCAGICATIEGVVYVLWWLLHVQAYAPTWFLSYLVLWLAWHAHP
jgi:hypothetical protein